MLGGVPMHRYSMQAPKAQSMARVVYVSQVHGRLSTAELLRIVYSARRWNERGNITGALFYCDGYFGQLLEGDYDPVALACGRIRRDGRHHRILQLESVPIAARLIECSHLKFFGDNGLRVRFPNLARALTSGKVDRANLLKEILSASASLSTQGVQPLST